MVVFSKKEELEFEIRRYCVFVQGWQTNPSKVKALLLGDTCEKGRLLIRVSYLRSYRR